MDKKETTPGFDSTLRTVELNTQLCVVGGGMAGLCAAIAAARQGIKTVLMHDRPVLGGNASGEVRMWIRGAWGDNCRETGILEEIMLEHAYRNPQNNISIWDSILYGKAQYQSNLTLLLNTSCLDAEMDGDRIACVKGWQSISQTFYKVSADYFADCSGDSILGALTPALFRYGRESRKEFNESFGPETHDRYTMGNSCLLQIREADAPVKFTPPEWAEKYRVPADLPPCRDYGLTDDQNFWYIEIGGTGNTIRDVDEHRERLLRIAFGLWDYLKNYSPDRELWANWELDWMGFIPGKRESRRMVGDYIMTANDVAAGGRFYDTVAYGGWSMDDHPPQGFDFSGEPTRHYKAPSPFGIPYRCLYSVNVSNLFFAGRNISVSHGALSATRVMATCAAIGEAVGTAAAVAAEKGITPRETGEKYIGILQQRLLTNNCFLPGILRNVPAQTMAASLESSNGSDPEPLRDGWDREWQGNGHCWSGRAGDSVTLTWEKPVEIRKVRLVLDSDLNRKDFSTVAVRRKNAAQQAVPDTLVRQYRIEYLDNNGKWQIFVQEDNNWQQLKQYSAELSTKSLRLTLLGGGREVMRVFSFDTDC